MHASIPLIVSFLFSSPALGFPNHQAGSLYIRDALPAAYPLDSIHPFSQRDRRIMGYRAMTERNAAPELLRRYPAHPFIAGGAAAFGTHEYLEHERAQGIPVHHEFLKEAAAGVAGAEIDKHLEGHGRQGPGNGGLARRQPDHKFLAGGAAALGTHEYLEHERAQGIPVHHEFLKEAAAGVAGAEVDKHLEGHRSG